MSCVQLCMCSGCSCTIAFVVSCHVMPCPVLNLWGNEHSCSSDVVMNCSSKNFHHKGLCQLQITLSIAN